MRRIALFILSAFVFLPSCGQVAHDAKTAKRLKDLEKSVMELEAQQSKGKEQLEKVSAEQEHVEGELGHAGQEVQTDQTEIATLQEEVQDDITKLEEVAAVVGQLLEPIYRMQTAIITLRQDVNSLSATQTQIVKQLPEKILEAPQSEQKAQGEVPVRPIDWKKYKKAMEEVG